MNKQQHSAVFTKYESIPGDPNNLRCKRTGRSFPIAIALTSLGNTGVQPRHLLAYIQGLQS